MKWAIEILFEAEGWTPETCNGFPHVFTIKRTVEAFTRHSAECAALMEFAGKRVVGINSKPTDEQD